MGFGMCNLGFKVICEVVIVETSWTYQKILYSAFEIFVSRVFVGSDSIYVLAF